MSEEKTKCCKSNTSPNAGDAGAGAVYGLGFVGALVYFLQGASGIEAILMGILKAMVWPSLLVYYLFRLLGI
jgi:hypothetical protein